METAEFLFPNDLEVTPTGLRKMLFIGSCLSEAYLIHMRRAHPSVKFEHILFNNASDLPVRSSDQLAEYDLQYIQLPLRSVLTDAVIRIADNEKAEQPLDWLELGKQNIDQMIEKAMSYNSQMGLLSIVSTFFVPQGHAAPSLRDARSSNDLCWVINELNNYLAETVGRYANAYLADADMIANTLGKRFFRDDFIGFYTHGSFHYPDWTEGGRFDAVPAFGETYENRNGEFCEAVFRQIETTFRIARQLDQVKVVIFDLDHTLWRGQLVEHYQPGMQWPHSHGWPLGIWEAVHHLRRRGIVTALASKNDHDIVSAKWGDAVSPPFVKFEDFMVPHINWKPKAENIAGILQALSLTPKSAVFVDDHPVERESVKATLPGIRVIGSNPFLTRRILMWSAETQLASRTEESKRREEMLEKQIQREHEKLHVSRETFLANLQCKVRLFELMDNSDPSFTRVSELVNKTNQFNTTSKRWDLPAYQAFWIAGGRVFAFSVSDRYTDYGLVGVIFARGSEIVQYVMSCRVLGMEIELAALNTVVLDVRSRGAGAIFGQVVPTSVNTPCRDVFVRCGFQPRAGADDVFELPSDQKVAIPGHVHVNAQTAEAASAV